ncbi:uncharacterized protein STEHIDRAFT_98383 [Stereum hirsutum FP-91666 SS1]|uniref:uncharacterized protein n=1 Tax=Stereum hirsutum (strain FP-91666) TaxID=721885 RepID=UPI000444A053|nr:uncharacterized protein STEHIDRAFT_98383 [Stereum hirsutum FP-91666 SS1]EIM86044.1 hypothetical protein STEHIDRAFT_98383 [Stereum hirsutum FP-91666 SS1]
MLSLRPDRHLLNPKFEGYKLHPLPEDVVSHHALNYKPTQSSVSGRAPLSFQEVQSRIRHNHLTVSPDSREAVYIDSDFKVVSVSLQEDGSPSFRVIHELPTPMQTSASETYQREYPSATFLTPTILLVSDGQGTLYVLSSSPSQQTEVSAIYELPPSFSSAPFRIHVATQTSPNSALVVLSARHREPAATNDDGTPYSAGGSHRTTRTFFDIFGVSLQLPTSESNSEVLPMTIAWHRRGEDVPLYCTYHAPSKAFLLAGSSPYRDLSGPPPTPAHEPSQDELAPVPRADENLDSSGPDSQLAKPPPYAWTQDSEELTIAFPLPATTPKSSINVLFTPQTLTVHVRGGLVAGEIPLPKYTAARLWGSIAPSSSFWTWDAQGDHTCGLLTLHLEKQHAGTRWPQILDSSVADIEVPETLDPSELYAIRESLEKYTTALREGKDASGLGLGSGVPSLAEGEMDEEADAVVGSQVCLTWAGVEDGRTPEWVGEGPEMLNVLSTPLPGIEGGSDAGMGEGNEVSLVLKHTLDGLLFSLGDGDAGPRWKHASTYSALAFVLASKRDTRFTFHVSSETVLAFESGSAAGFGGNAYIYRGVDGKGGRGKDGLWAKQSILKVGGGTTGALMGVGALRAGDGKAVILCLCESEIVCLRDVV